MEEDDLPSGPFASTLAYLSASIDARLKAAPNDFWLPYLRLFALGLPDGALDGPPFTLAHPDFNSQNILVQSDGTISGLIDWDGTSTHPRQAGAAAFPAWLTVDYYDPMFYGWDPKSSAADNARFDSPERLRAYRAEYLAAMHRASEGRHTEATRNSHIVSNLINAVE